MKYLQILNAALLALGASMAVILSVVCLQYAIYLGDAPQIRGDLPGLLTATGLFTGLAVASALPFVAHRRRWWIRWPLQLLPLVPIVGVAMFFLSLRA